MVAVLVPIDKLKFKNVVRYDNYCGFVRVIASGRLVFVDKKSVKGCELYNKKGRSDLLTGEQPVEIVPSNFCDTYCLMGMCSMNKTKKMAILYSIGEF